MNTILLLVIVCFGFVWSFVPLDTTITLSTTLRKDDPPGTVPRVRRSPGDEVYLNTTLRKRRSMNDHPPTMSTVPRVRRSPSDEIYLNTTLRKRRNTELNATLRAERSATPLLPLFDIKICCGKPTKLPEYPDECTKYFDKGDGLDGEEKLLAIALGAACATECAEKISKTWDGQRFNKTLYVELIKDFYPEKWTEAIVVKNFDFCVEIAERKQQEVLRVDDTFKCNAVPFMVDACLYKLIELECPKDLMVQSNECNKIRENLKDSSM